MRRKIAAFILGCAVLATPGAAPAEFSEAQEAALSQEIQRAIQRLGDDSYAVRQDAAKELLEIGTRALPALRTASQSSDAETASRASDLLNSIKLGIDAETSPKVASILQKYASSNANDRIVLISQLAQLKEKGIRNLLLIAETETDTRLQERPHDFLHCEPNVPIRYLLVRGEMKRLEAFLDDGGTTGKNTDRMAREWAAYTLLRGQYELQRKRLELEIRNTAGDARIAATRKLFFLHRAHGNLDLALDAARQSGVSTLLYAAMLERADWPAVARHKFESSSASYLQFRNLSAQALAAQFAGETDLLERRYQDIRALSDKRDESGGRYPTMLKLLGRPNEAIKAMLREGYWSRAMQLFAERGCYKEAFFLAARARLASTPELPRVMLQEASILYGLGEKERAAAILRGLGDNATAALDASKNAPLVEDSVPPGWALNASIGEIAKAWKTIGDEEKGLQLAAAFLERFPPSYPAPRHCNLFYSFFDDGGSIYDNYSAVLHEMHPEKSMLEILHLVSDIVARRIKGDEFMPLARAVYLHVREREKIAAPENTQASGERLRAWAAQLHQDLQALGARGEFVDMLAADGVPAEFEGRWRQVTLRRARSAIRNRDWITAMVAYEAIARNEKKDWPRYIQAFVLKQGGFKLQGDALQRQTEWFLMGSEDQRYALAEEADELGLKAMAREQYQWLLRNSTPTDVYWVNAALELIAGGTLDVPRTRRLLESVMVAHSIGPGGFLSSRADTEVALCRQQHDMAARQAASEKDWKVVVRELRAGMALYPDDVDIVIALAPQLDAAGMTAETDALVQHQVAYLEDLLKSFPRAANHHNSLAWLCGRTKRSLDVGLHHAKQAVAYFPRTAGYIDTLAEVHFARGEFAEAVAVEKSALEIDPTSQVLGDSLARFEAALEKN